MAVDAGGVWGGGGESESIQLALSGQIPGAVSGTQPQRPWDSIMLMQAALSPRNRQVILLTHTELS